VWRQAVEDVGDRQRRAKTGIQPALTQHAKTSTKSHTHIGNSGRFRQGVFYALTPRSLNMFTRRHRATR
jgi:hypothetical protein